MIHNHEVPGSIPGLATMRFEKRPDRLPCRSFGRFVLFEQLTNVLIILLLGVKDDKLFG